MSDRESSVDVPAVRVKGLSKSYGDLRAADDVSFEVGAGEVFGVLGPNGAGKTTVLECLEGLRQPDSGRLEVCGVDIQDEASVRRLVGVQLQVAGLPATMRVGEAMRFFCAYRGIPPRLDLMERFQLTDKMESPYSSLSGGQQRRLALALALAHDPSILILDEPTSGLDVPSRAQLHDLIRELRSGGTTVLLATHDMAEAEALCDRVLIMLKGKTVAIASPEELTASSDGLTTVSVRTVGNVFADSMTVLPGTRASVIDGDYLRCLSHDPVATVGYVLARVETSGDELIDLRVQRPSLEERFLELTADRAESEEVTA